VAALTAVVLLAACQSEPDLVVIGPPPPAVVRTDTPALTAKFPALGEPVSASWVTWDSDGPADLLPSPTVTWIDAVVRLQPATAADLVSRYRPAARSETPTVQDLLRRALPAGPFLTGDALDRAFTSRGWSSWAYLDPKTRDLVLKSTRG
jgi:hypothetical protein